MFTRLLLAAMPTVFAMYPEKQNVISLIWTELNIVFEISEGSGW